MSAAVRPEDIAFNRVSVALARSQSLVASWLPAPSAEDATVQKTPEQLQQEESALFTPGSDILGVGAEPPKDILDGSFKRTQLSSNERLRQQILGKHTAAKGRGAQLTDNKAAHLPTKKLDRPTRPSRVQEDSDDEEVGRASMFKSRRRMAPALIEKMLGEPDNCSKDDVNGMPKPKQAAPAAPVSPVQEKPRKRPMSYLDEMLEERRKKQKMKQKAQAEQPVKAEKEVKPTVEKEAKTSEGKAHMDDSEEANGKATLKEVSQKHEAEKPDTSADVPMADGAEKKKKKKKNKKRKKNREETSEQT